jgi:hypothetical protein
MPSAIATKEAAMSNDLAYAMFLIHQRQARDISEHHQLEHLFLTFVGGEMSAEDYERNLQLTARRPTATAPGRAVRRAYFG